MTIALTFHLFMYLVLYLIIIGKLFAPFNYTTRYYCLCLQNKIIIVLNVMYTRTLYTIHWERITLPVTLNAVRF